MICRDTTGSSATLTSAVITRVHSSMTAVHRWHPIRGQWEGAEIMREFASFGDFLAVIIIGIILLRSYERAKSTQKSTDGSAGEPDSEPVSRCQRTVLVGLKSDFLGKHHVAHN
jgi:hypothetical protein